MKSEFLSGQAWDFVFEGGMDTELPDRLWTSVLASAEVRSPWVESDLRLLEVKGLGNAAPVR